MRPGLALLCVASCAAAEPVPLALRGRNLSLARLAPAGRTAAAEAVIFLPGDGGWRGAAVTMSRAIAGLGYEVYGFDTKKYLESFESLSGEQMAEDMRAMAAQVADRSKKRVILVGWSQGAGMAVAAVSGRRELGAIRGVVTLGLPENGVLGWDWKATLAIIARREPDQPHFAVKPLLQATAAALWMIHGTEDEYTPAEAGQALYRAAAGPKRLEEIAGANHRFDGHEDELYRSMKEGLAWVVRESR